jgi:hypothetical protein
MTRASGIIALVGLALASTLGDPAPAAAQDTGTPRPRSSPAINPGQLGAMSSPQRFLVTSSANDRGTFLWVVDAVEHNVTLCEKPAAAAEFTCNKKPLP